MLIIRQERQKTEHTSFVLVQRGICGVVYDQIGTCVQPYVLGLKNTFNNATMNWWKGLTLYGAHWADRDTYGIVQNSLETWKKYKPCPHLDRQELRKHQFLELIFLRMSHQLLRDQDETLRDMYMQLQSAQLERPKTVKIDGRTQPLPWKIWLSRW